MTVETVAALLNSVPAGGESFQKMAVVAGLLNYCTSDRLVSPKRYCLGSLSSVQLSINTSHDRGHDTSDNTRCVGGYGWVDRAGLRQAVSLFVTTQLMKSLPNSDKRLLEYAQKLAAQHETEQEKFDRELFAAVERLREELIDRLKWTERVLDVLGRPVSRPIGTGIPPPVLDAIRNFLRNAGSPQPAARIVHAVGEQRHRDFPELTRPFADVSKSLQYHDRTHGEIVCVQWEGDRLVRAGLKIKFTPSSRRGQLDGLIWFRDEIRTYTQ